MGYNIKKIPNTNISVDLDKTYKFLIKPTLIKKKLIAVSSNDKNKHTFRADEIFTTQAIDRTFISNLYRANIVIADITALNQNAIYELGMRHAMRPKSTIIMCDKKTMQNNKFFDLTFNPQIFYDSEKQEDPEEKKRISKLLSEIIDVCKHSDDNYIDSPVFNYQIYDFKNDEKPNENQLSLMSKIAEGNTLLENEKYAEAETVFKTILNDYKFIDYQIICSYILSIYRKEESKNNLLYAMDEFKKYIDINHTTVEDILGIFASINLKLFNISQDPSNLYTAIEYYRRGTNYENGNIYCGRNYCSTLLKIYMIEDNIDILREYYYTAVHTAKLLMNHTYMMQRKSDNYNNVWFKSNINDLLLISNFVTALPSSITEATKRQQRTINDGQEILIKDLKNIKEKLGI